MTDIDWQSPDWNRINDVQKDPPATSGNLRPFTDDDRERLRRSHDEVWTTGMAEVYQEAYISHVLMDEAGVPVDSGYGGDLDVRVSTLIQTLDSVQQHSASLIKDLEALVREWREEATAQAPEDDWGESMDVTIAADVTRGRAQELSDLIDRHKEEETK